MLRPPSRLRSRLRKDSLIALNGVSGFAGHPLFVLRRLTHCPNSVGNLERLSADGGVQRGDGGHGGIRASRRPWSARGFPPLSAKPGCRRRGGGWPPPARRGLREQAPFQKRRQAARTPRPSDPADMAPPFPREAVRSWQSVVGATSLRIPGIAGWGIVYSAPPERACERGSGSPIKFQSSEGGATKATVPEVRPRATSDLGVEPGEEKARVIPQKANVPAKSANVLAGSANVLVKSANALAKSANVLVKSGSVLAESAKVLAKSAKVPAESGNVPAKSANVPAKSAKVPAKSGNVPAKSGNVPAKSANVPAKSGNVPAKSGNVPAKSGNVVTKSAPFPRILTTTKHRRGPNPCWPKHMRRPHPHPESRGFATRVD